MITVTVNIKGLDDSVKLLEKIKQNVNDNRYGLNKVKDYLLKFFSDDVFGSQGAVFGQSWSQLTASSLREKTKSYPGRGILERTGTLRKGFKAQSSTNYLKIYNPVPYGIFHQTGTSRMPPRIFMQLDTQRVTEIAKIIGEELVKNALK
jgi:phage gpG-like protein